MVGQGGEVSAGRTAPVEMLGPVAAGGALAAVGLYALVALPAADAGVASVFARLGFGDRVTLRLGIGGLIVALAVYLLADGGTSWRSPDPASHRLMLYLSGLWVAGVCIGTFGLREGTTHYRNPEVILRSLVVTVLVEELVFRGALFALAERVCRGRPGAWLSFPVVFTAILFWLGHLQGYGFHVGLWFDARGYTILGGLVFGTLRHRTGSLWPSIVFHSVGNTLALLAGSL